MPFRPPLTADELRAIKERNHDPDVRTLLWEVSRLRHLARASNQVLPMCNPVGATARMLHNALKAKLDEEACVIEHRAMAEELINPDRFVRDSDSGIGSGEPFRPSVRRR
jgi:hypothetical protein